MNMDEIWIERHGLQQKCGRPEKGKAMDRGEELRMTYSGLLLKDGEKMVRVCF